MGEPPTSRSYMTGLSDYLLSIPATLLPMLSFSVCSLSWASRLGRRHLLSPHPSRRRFALVTPAARLSLRAVWPARGQFLLCRGRYPPSRG